MKQRQRVTKQSLSLGEAAFSFLTSLPPEERKDKQQEVNRFILWYGKERFISQITPVEVANYAAWVAASTGDTAKKLEPVRAFLTYAKKEGLVEASLAPHLRVKASPKTPLPTKPKQQVALTPEDYVQLKSQLAALEEERGRIAEELRRAAADKDFRENAPLQAAREHRDQVEAQIRQLQATISTGVVVEEKPAEESAVRLGSKVILCDIASGKKLTYTIVTKNEANPAKNKISIVSPLGKALLNQRQGNVVKVIAPAGELCYQIEQIE
jgi:transcription elongation factor GreA